MDMSQMNFVDIIILIIFFVSMITGFVRGLISEVISLTTLIAAFVIAIMFSNSLAAYFTNTETVRTVVDQTTNAIGTSTATPVSYLALGVSFGLLFFVTILIGAIVKYIINIPFQYGMLGLGNRVFGGVFGLARGFIINLVLIFLVQISPLGTQPWWVNSSFVRSYQPAVGWLGNAISPALADLRAKFDSTLQGVNSQIKDFTGGL